MKVTLTTVDGAKSPGEIQIRRWDQKERFHRALRGLGLCWGLAVVSVFIPLAHFVLVPGFLIAGPVVFKVFHGETDTILGGTAKCPKCGQDFKIIRAREKWPLKDLCSNCQSEVVIEPAHG